MAENVSKFFVFWDTRVKGNMASLGYFITQQFNSATSITAGFPRINAVAKNGGKIKTLFLIAHGLGSGWFTDDFWWRGGLGLQLGRENLTATNVSLWSAIKNSVENIVVYSCGAAYTGPQPPMKPPSGNTHDGKSLMLSLARNTNAVVFAPERIQRYSASNLNMGKWEGQVYMFLPAGSGLIVPNMPPPIQLMDVLTPS